MKKAKVIMLQGTASSVGKSLLTAALCRIFHQEGYRVSPFKSQNMALNSYITDEGLEMGRAQVFQAEAAAAKPSVIMNPILLKPTADAHAQVIIKGKVYDNMTAIQYQQFKPSLRTMLRDIYEELSSSCDVVVIEGAGSPAEINLKENDIVNMGMAEIADAPVILIGDIDRGGVFASLYGTIMLLTEEEKARVKGIIINKFRGDIKILEPGLRMLEDLTGKPVLGVIPYGDFCIEDEDSVSERLNRRTTGDGKVRLDIICLPHISNYTDFHVFELFPEASIRYVTHLDSFDRPDAIIIPGTKNTIADLKYLRETGLEKSIIEAHKQGTVIFGICGGFQMLGHNISDPMGVESSLSCIRGLGLLDMETIFEGDKVTTQVEGKVAASASGVFQSQQELKVRGYEIHMGRTILGEGTKPFIEIYHRLGEDSQLLDGAVDEKNQVFGTYIHGIFDDIGFTRCFLDYFMAKKGYGMGEKTLTLEEFKEAQYNKLAEVVKSSLNMEEIFRIMEVSK